MKRMKRWGWGDEGVSLTHKDKPDLGLFLKRHLGLDASAYRLLAALEALVKAVLALTASVPAPREILAAGRLAGAPGVLDALAERLAGVATASAAAGLGPRAKTAAQGAAVLADGLAGGRYAALAERLRLREASGTALDHLRMHGAERIRLA
jgi:predicted butyrate kinase (DUF1464 family)